MLFLIKISLESVEYFDVLFFHWNFHFLSMFILIKTTISIKITIKKNVLFVENFNKRSTTCHIKLFKLQCKLYFSPMTVVEFSPSLDWIILNHPIQISIHNIFQTIKIYHWIFISLTKINVIFLFLIIYLDSIQQNE